MYNNNYPQQHESLLRKAGLLGSGYLEVKAIHRYKTQHVSEDGITFEVVKRPEIDDLAIGSTTPIFNSSGQIAGYWANGLTVEERRIINEECGVPYFYLNEPINALSGMPSQPDTTLTIREGQIFDLSNPKDVAYVRCISEIISTIGMNKQEALDNGAMFYFFSREEEKEEKQKVVKERKSAAKLVDELSSANKQQIVKILALDGNLPVDPYISVEASVEVFDEIAFTMPKDVYNVHIMENKVDYICAKSLIHSGHIEAASLDGPYYKNATIYGQRYHIADSLSELIVKIHSHKDLINAYRNLETIIVGDHGSRNVINANEASVLGLFSKHGIIKNTNADTTSVSNDEFNFKSKVKFMTIDQVIKAMDNEGIVHNYDSSSNLKEVKEFYLKSHSV